MKTSWLRAGLLFLATATQVVGVWALLVPRSFYDDFPLPGRDWVSTLGPYNEHLVRDVGALNLALGVLLTTAAIFLERRLVQISLVAYLVYAVPTSSSISRRAALSPPATTSRTWSPWESPSSCRSSCLSVRAAASERHEAGMAEKAGDGEVPVSEGRALWRRRGG